MKSDTVDAGAAGTGENGTAQFEPARYQVRRATSADVDEIFKLTSTMAKQGLMLPRSKYKIISMLTGFFVVIDNEGGVQHPDNVVACGAFVPLWTDMGEILALAVKQPYQGKGVGRMLIDALTGGNVLASGAFGTSKDVVAGNTPAVNSGPSSSREWGRSRQGWSTASAREVCRKTASC